MNCYAWPPIRPLIIITFIKVGVSVPPVAIARTILLAVNPFLVVLFVICQDHIIRRDLNAWERVKRGIRLCRNGRRAKSDQNRDERSFYN